jgi:hypothetical protein
VHALIVRLSNGTTRFPQMSIREFWSLIERCDPSSFDMDRKATLLEHELRQLDSSDLGDFYRHYWSLRAKAYHWPLWDAASVSYGGCGDDSFMDFRSSLITFGEQVFENALSDPDTLGDLPQRIPTDAGIFAVIHNVTASKLGNDHRLDVAPQPAEPTGRSAEDEQDDDGIEQEEAARFPRLSALASRLKATSVLRSKPWWKIW